MPRRLVFLISLACSLSIASAQQHPTPAAARWWAITTALSNDDMQGRDTGTEAYERAAKYVAVEFKSAGLKPAGDGGTYFQSVPMHQVSLVEGTSFVRVHGANGKDATLAFPTQVTTTPTRDLNVEAALIFVGYGIPSPGTDLKGKVAVLFNNTPSALSAKERDEFAQRRATALGIGGVAAIIAIDNPGSIEPFHWPSAYARSVTLADSAPMPAGAVPTIRVDSAAAAALLPNPGAYADILTHGIKGDPLPTIAGPTVRIEIHTEAKDIASPNIIGILPGSDASLATEYVALSAHLDGYGFGTPVNGDRLYNGALDDAAYVATLIELAQEIAHAPLKDRPRRSLLFCIFTGEEKGLLGSAYYTHHLTVPREKIVADLNLDQLRPIFPLTILTMEGLTDSSLGATVQTLAGKDGIEIRPDLEPERNLFRRADNYNFVRIGVPIASFIFGYNRGSAEERIYRDWYARRYHKPQDDLSTPIDWKAAVKFNLFYRELTLAVANADARPTWSAGSAYAPKNK